MKRLVLMTGMFAAVSPALGWVETDVSGEMFAEPAAWPGLMVIIILGMFLLAAGVGVVVRMNMPEELPETHSHDEPPGASHHHGAGGTHGHH
jgi:putative Mn2+ efflux pump MntP